MLLDALTEFGFGSAGFIKADYSIIAVPDRQVDEL
jgi:hypothetical protein